MSRFSHHESCPSCGSKDNLGVWTDGHKFCFGCKYYEQGVTDLHKAFLPTPSPQDTYLKDFPHDAGLEIPSQPLRWLYSCGIYQEQITKNNIRWSQRQQLVCWQIKNPSGVVLGWQGRCFDPQAKTKYVIHGKIHDDLCLLGEQRPIGFCDDGETTCVIVEDYLSAIRISSFLPCVPLFGCTIKVEHLRTLYKRFNTIIVWLDSDKLDNARKIASKASMVGLHGKVLYTPLDPKEYKDTEIKDFLDVLL